MVRLLIRMRAAAMAHQGSTRFARVSALLIAALGLLLAVSTLLVGAAGYPSTAAGTDVVAVTLAVWVVGRLAYAAFSGGDGALRYEMFRMLPVRRSRLSRALLVVGLLDPAGVVLVVAFSALIALGAHAGPLPTLVGVVGMLLTVLVTNILATIVAALNPQGSRRTRDLGTVLVAAVISLVAVAGTVLPALTAALIDGTAPAVAAAARLLPSGWAAVAVEGATLGDPLEALVPLAGLVGVALAAVLVWPLVLGRRLDGRAAESGRRRGRRPSAAVLPQTPTGAVVAKELRLWLRDPNRVTFLVIGAIVGVGVSVVPELTLGSGVMLPFAGVLTVIVAVAGASNLYGTDGRSLGLTVLTPGSAVPDIRGRQIAWLLIVGVYAVLVGGALAALSGAPWAVPAMLAVTLAVLGGGLGLFPLASLISVQTTDGRGGLTPAWVVKAYAALLLTALTGVPAAAVLVAAAVEGSALLAWLAVLVGAATGTGLAIGLGRVAARRLDARQLDILAVVTAATSSS